jgi:hypothetical protein
VTSARVARLRRLVRLWDEAVRVPGTPFAVGLDALVGLVPGLGDAVGGVVSGTLLLAALREGAPPAIAARMLLNILLDVTLGAVPVLGDLFDAGFRANRRNLDLLERWLADPARARRSSRLALGAAATAALGILAAAVCAAVWLARAALRLVAR